MFTRRHAKLVAIGAAAALACWLALHGHYAVVAIAVAMTLAVYNRRRRTVSARNTGRLASDDYRRADYKAVPGYQRSFECAVCGQIAGRTELLASDEPVTDPSNAGEEPTANVDELLRRQDKVMLEVKTGYGLGAQPVRAECVDVVIEAIAEADASALYNTAHSYAPFYCPECTASYCGEHWHWSSFEVGGMSGIAGSCQRGHFHVLRMPGHVNVRILCAVCGKRAASLELLPPGQYPAGLQGDQYVEIRERWDRIRKKEPWWLRYDGPAAGSGAGHAIGEDRAECIAAGFAEPLSYARVHDAGFYDDAGFCGACGKPYCYQHWNVTGAEYGAAPRAMGRASTRTSRDLYD